MFLKRIFSTLIVAAIFQVSFAQNLKLEYDSSRANIQKNNFIGAINWLEKAKNSALLNPKDTNSYVEVLKLLAISYAKTNRLVDAENTFKDVHTLYNLMPTKKPQYAASLQNFGVFYYNQKKFKEAEPVFAKSLDVKKQVTGEANAEYLNILNSLASCRLNLKKYKEAEQDYQSLVTLRKQVLGESHSDYLAALNGLGNIYKILGKNKEAIQLYEQVASLTKVVKTENSKEYALVLGTLSNLYKSLSQYDKAEPTANESAQVYQRVSGEKSVDYGIALTNLAGINRNLGKYETAEPQYTKAVNILKDVTGEYSAEYASGLNNLALFYSETGKYELSENTFRQALEVSKKVLGEKHPETSTTINNLGLLYRNMGKYDQAEPLFKKALANRKATTGEKTVEYASILNNLGGLYQYTGRLDQAEIHYKQSLSITNELLGENAEYASTANNLAGVYELQKKYSQAEPLYSKSIEIIKNLKGESHPDYVSGVNNLAVMYQSQGKNDQAADLFRKVLDATKISLGERHPNYATSLNNYAILLEASGKAKDAEANFLQVLNLRKEILGENHPAFTATLYDLAVFYACQKNYTQSDIYWEKALTSYLYQIDTYFPAMSEKEKGKFYEIIEPKFEQFNSYCELRMKDNPSILSKMYDYQLATKALLLNASNKVKQRILNSGDQAIIQKFKTWNSQKELISRSYSLSKEELKKQGINLAELLASAEDLEKELSSSSELFKSANESSRVSWIEVQKKLKTDEAAVEMIRYVKFKFDSTGILQPDSIHYAALIISPNTKSNPEIIVLKNGAELEKQMIKYYRNAIKYKSDDDLSYRQYWARLKDKFISIKTLYFSPDGVYNQLNINTLKNTQTKQYVADEIEIKVVSNTKDLLSVKYTENPQKSISLFGSPDFTMNARNVSNIVPGISAENATFIERSSATLLSPLPGTKVEVEKISGMMSTNSWKTDIYTEQNAIEENIKAQNNPKVLHIATHGFFEGDVNTSKKRKNKDTEDEIVENPLLKSGLYLAGSSLTLLKKKNDQINIDITADKSKEDGVLTAYEAMNLNLEKTDLVVLSACETGLGEVKNGEGVYGLQRSFNVAGAKSIIYSLWTVNDVATQKLMTNFYQEWIKTGNKRTAFKNAQSALRKEMPEPYFWGAFVMIGE
jgi:CHAT domain-containing protein/Tfp pilus assembly protein PilF